MGDFFQPQSLKLGFRDSEWDSSKNKATSPQATSLAQLLLYIGAEGSD